MYVIKNSLKGDFVYSYNMENMENNNMENNPLLETQMHQICQTEKP